MSYLEQVLSLIGQYGYLIVFFGVMLESGGALGLLVPGEAILIAAGILAHRGTLDLGDAI
ncbi:MAG: DedA family protein, partial [Rubrobacter sp.]|nr:DedA family protein [Rubrobacter sp.]